MTITVLTDALQLVFPMFGVERVRQDVRLTYSLGRSRDQSKKTVNEKACRLAKMGKILTRITALRVPVVAHVQGTMAARLAELAYAMFLDPADCFDDFGRPLSILAMPDHVRRAIMSSQGISRYD